MLFRSRAVRRHWAHSARAERWHRHHIHWGWGCRFGLVSRSHSRSLGFVVTLCVAPSRAESWVSRLRFLVVRALPRSPVGLMAPYSPAVPHHIRWSFVLGWTSLPYAPLVSRPASARLNSGRVRPSECGRAESDPFTPPGRATTFPARRGFKHAIPDRRDEMRSRLAQGR